MHVPSDDSTAENSPDNDAISAFATAAYTAKQTQKMMATVRRKTRLLATFYL